MVGKKEIKKVSDILNRGNDFSLPLVSELEGKEITIENIRFGAGKYGEYAVITLDNGKEYRTSSMVLLEQLKELQKYINDYKITGTVKKVKKYYMLV